MNRLGETTDREHRRTDITVSAGREPVGGVEGLVEGPPGPFITKLATPHQGYLLPRRRLRSAVSSLRHGGVVSVVAGPGYGKTAFLVDALVGGTSSVAYYALDEGDRDPAQFLDYLIQACARAHPGLGDAARSRLDECLDVGRESFHVIATLLGEMTSFSGSPTIIAFDDLQAVDESEAVVAALGFLIDGLPSRWTLLFSSRRRLPFPVADLRQRGRLAEVDLRRLRLTPSEVGQWARRSWGLELSLAEARTLWRLTEGWPVALVLLGQRLQHGGRPRIREEVVGLSRQGRHLNEYLSDTVFRSLSPETAEILKEGAFASRLVFPRDAPLFVRGGPAAEEALAELVARGFLVTETGHRTYTMHRLLRSFVTREARRSDPVGATELARSTARHLAQVGESREAISLYLQNGLAREAVGPLRALASSHLDASSAYGCEEWLDLLPPDVLSVQPWLLSLRARILQGRGEYQAAEPLYRTAARLFEADDDRVGLLQAVVGRAFCLYLTGRWDDSLAALSRAEGVASTADERAEVNLDMANVLLSQCRWDEAVERYEAVLVLAKGASRTAFEVRVFGSRGRLFFLRGRYGTALEWVRQAVALSSGQARVGYAATLNAAATLLYLTGQYEDATIQAESALALVKARGYMFLEAPVLLALAGVALGKRDVRTALAHVKKAQALSKTAQDLESDLWAEDMLGDICRRNRSPEKAVAHHRRVLAMVEAQRLSTYEQARGQCGLGMALAVLGKSAEARAELEQGVELSRRWGFDALLSQGLLYVGWLYALSGAEQSARRALAESMRLASEHSHVHYFLQEAGVATPILALCVRHGVGGFLTESIVPRLTTRLRAYFDELTAGPIYPTDVVLGPPRYSRLSAEGRAGRPLGEAEDPLIARIERLTVRELEILQMIAAGLPNKVIAARLYITEKTVKTHANRIYRKLNVTNRLQAVLALQEYQKARGVPTRR